MATKRGRSGPRTKSTKTAPKPAARRGATPPAVKPAAKAAGTKATVTVAPTKAAAAARTPSALERAEALRDAIQRSKLTAPDPWAYTAKARGWAQRAQDVVNRLAGEADSPAARQALDKLAAEVEGDRDFQEARRLF